MSSFRPSRLAIAAVAMVVVGCQAGASQSANGSPQPSAAASAGSPSPISAAPTVVPTASPPTTASLDPNDTSTWLPFVSERYGFSLAYPAGWEAHHASALWAFPQDTAWPDGVEHGDWFYLDGPDDGVAASAWSVPLPSGTSADEWFDDYCAIEITPCETSDPKSPASLDGHPGWFVAGSDPQAYFGIGDRIFLVAVWQPEDNPALVRYGGGRKLVEAFLSTMRLLADPA